MKASLLARWLMCFVLMCAVFRISAYADLKIRVRETSETPAGAVSSENLLYFKGLRQREEWDHVTYIYQCDLRRNISIDKRRKRYEIADKETHRKSQSSIERWQAKQERDARERRRGGVITISTIVVDTGERREMFGYTARRIKTTQIVETSPDACSQTRQRREIDGWYADLLFGLYCSPNISGKSPVDEQLGYAQAGLGMLSIGDPTKSNVSYGLGFAPFRITKDCADEVRFVENGSARFGFPLVETSTSYFDDSPAPTRTVKREVVEISDAELDALLFVEPAGSRRVKYGELFRQR